MGTCPFSDDMVTYEQAVEKTIHHIDDFNLKMPRTQAIDVWTAAKKQTKNTLDDLQKLADTIGIYDDRLQFETQSTRTSEGFFPIDAGLDLAITRSNAIAPYACMSWCELDTSSLVDSKTFAAQSKAGCDH